MIGELTACNSILKNKIDDLLKCELFFFFGSVGSSLLRWLSLVAASRGYSSLRCTGFSLWWLLVAEHRL